MKRQVESEEAGGGMGGVTSNAECFAGEEGVVDVQEGWE